MSMEKNLNNFIDELIQEIEKELDEATTTANVAGYNVPGAFSDGGRKDKKRKKKISTQFGMKIVGKIDEDDINEGLVSPKRGHEYFQLTKDAPIKYIAGHSGLGLTTPGVLLKNIPGFIDGKKGAYLIDYHGALFYVDLKKKVAVRLGYDLSKQPKLRYKSNFIEVDKAPDFSDWKKYLKESVNEAMKPSQVRSAISKVKKQLMRKWKQKGGYENFGQKELSQMRDKFNYNPYGSSDERQISKMLDGFDDWAMNYDGNMREDINEAKQKRPVNRWLELKNDESMHPHKKMAMGLKELKYQLRETEKFFNWYNKIKTMNELDSNQYWKRTNNHIYKIKERLINIARTIQEIEK